MINVILHFLELDLVNINVSAKFYQTIQNGLRVKFHRFQNLNLGKTSTNPKCHLTISWATSCQYTNVYAKFHHSIPLSSRDRAIFTFFFQNLELGKTSTDHKCHFAIVSLFSEFEPRQKLNQSQVSFDNRMGYILSISMCMQTFITIFDSVQEIAPLSLFQNLELNVYAEVYQNIPLNSRDKAIFPSS